MANIFTNAAKKASSFFSKITNNIFSGFNITGKANISGGYQQFDQNEKPEKTTTPATTKTNKTTTPASRPNTPNSKSSLSREEQITKLGLLADHVQTFARTDLPEGTFRLSVSLSDLNQIVQNPKNEGIGGLDAMQSSAAIKKIVRELDPPLIAQKIQENLADLLNQQKEAKTEDEKKVAKTQTDSALKTELTNNPLLQKVVDAFLHATNEKMHSQEGAIPTKMSLDNLSIVAGPNLFGKLEALGTGDQFSLAVSQNSLAKQLLDVAFEIKKEKLLQKDNLGQNIDSVARSTNADAIAPATADTTTKAPATKKITVAAAPESQRHDSSSSVSASPNTSAKNATAFNLARQNQEEVHR